MKNPYSYFLLTLACGAFIGVQAQVVTLKDASQAVVNGTVITISESLSGDTAQTPGIGLEAENTSGSARTINVKRYEVSVPGGTGNYFCWDVCYGEIPAGLRPEWTAFDPIYMVDGLSVNGFHAYYKPYGVVGDATFRYVWYDVDSPNDSTWVDIVFNTTAVGITEVSAVRGFSAFPNPSVAGNITFNYDLATASAGTQLVVYNMLGERKVVKAIGAAQGTVVLNDGDLSSGVWFAVLERNGKRLATKRVVVLR